MDGCASVCHRHVQKWSPPHQSTNRTWLQNPQRKYQFMVGMFRQYPENRPLQGGRRFSTSKFREVLFICPICVYGPILLAGGGQYAFKVYQKKKRAPWTHIGESNHLCQEHPFTNIYHEWREPSKKIVHVARSIFCVICVSNVFWVAGTSICLFSVK